MHSDLLAIVLLQFWFCRDHLLTIYPSVSFSPTILILPYFFPFVQNNSIAPLMVLFSYKNWPLGFSSTTTQIGSSILGQIEVFQVFCSRSSMEPNCRQMDQGFWASSLLPVPSCRKMARLFFCALLTSEPAALKCRCGACWPASQLASHQEFFMPQAPGESSFS